MSDQFVACTWSCEKCRQKGTVRPWQRTGESASNAAGRHALETRMACVQGCRYIAKVIVESEKVSR